MSIAEDLSLEVEGIAPMLDAWEELDTRELPEGFKLTGTFKLILERLQYALKIKAPLMSLTGAHGVGKTTACRYFAETSGALMWQCKPGTKPKHLLREIARALGIEGGQGWDMQTSIVSAQLAESPRVFLLDEAQRLDYAGLDLLKWLADESGSTFALIASSSLETRISRWPDIDTRCPVKVRVDPLSLSELRSIYESEGYSREALVEIHRQTQGIMRNLNYLMLHLQEAFARSQTVSGPKQLSSAHVRFLSKKVFG